VIVLAINDSIMKIARQINLFLDEQLEILAYIWEKNLLHFCFVVDLLVTV
jgi:hypothetical protein